MPYCASARNDAATPSVAVVAAKSISLALTPGALAVLGPCQLAAPPPPAPPPAAALAAAAAAAAAAAFLLAALPALPALPASPAAPPARVAAPPAPPASAPAASRVEPSPAVPDWLEPARPPDP